MREELLRAGLPADDDVELNADVSLRPRSLADFVGQRELKDHLEIILEAARRRSQAVDHVLLAGPPGLGKTSLAGIIATEMDVAIHVTSGPAIERAGDLAAMLSQLGEGDVLFIDEIHRLPRVVEEVLYPAMEDFQIDIVLGKGPAARSIRLDLPRFTLVGATTRTGSITGPLRDRFGLVARLDYYDPAELESIVTRAAGILEVTIDSAGAHEIARRDRGVGHGRAVPPVRLHLPRSTVVVATTRAGSITGPLRDRCGLVARLDYYDPAELESIVTRAAGILEVTIDSAVAHEIARRARGTPRIANRLLRRVRDYAEVRGDGSVDIDPTSDGLALFGVDQPALAKVARLTIPPARDPSGAGPVG